MDRLGRAKQFKQLDFTSVYHWIKIRKKISGRSRSRLDTPTLISFGLTNALISFQRFINKIFAENIDIFIIAYLDDILIYTDDDGDGHVAVV